MAVGYKLAWLALMGALGTLCRYGLDGAVLRACGTRFPWGILVVNALGCFLFGLIWPLAEDRMLISSETRSLVLIGFMGAFTTFRRSRFRRSSFCKNRSGIWPSPIRSDKWHWDWCCCFWG